MKIIFNGLPVVYPMSGVGQYTLQLGRALEALLGNEKIFWFGTNLSNCGHNYSANNGPDSLNRLQYGLRKYLRKMPGLNTLVHHWRNHQFQSSLRKIKPSLYHETKYVPFNFEIGPTLITIYDLSFLRNPEWHPADRVRHLEKYFLKRLSQAEAIITISEFSKKEISNLLNVDPTKIHVTYPGVDPSFSPEGKRMEGLPSRYTLFLGNLEPRKNLIGLLNAYRSLPRNLREKYPLVIAGANAWHTQEFKKAVDSFRERGKPILTGYVTQSKLPDLYRGASLFVFPSLYEGFGLPVLEAMATGIPVIASNSTSLPEVVADAGVLVNPLDVDAWKEEMLRLLEDEKARGRMSEKGLARAKLFSWEKCARETLTIYEKCLEGKEAS